MPIHTFKALKVSLRAIAVFTVLTGVVYPLLVAGLSQILFSYQANGSLLKSKDQVVGSKLIGQNFTKAEFFQGRPSAAGYSTLPSGASNLGLTSTALKDAVSERNKNLGEHPPVDLLTTSGSGLDPHITLKAAQFQVERISKARGLDSNQTSSLMTLIDQLKTTPTFGFLGKEHINVLSLNLELNKFLEKNSP